MMCVSIMVDRQSYYVNMHNICSNNLSNGRMAQFAKRVKRLKAGWVGGCGESVGGGGGGGGN